MCSQARRVVSDFNHQGLCNVAWSLSRLGHHDPALMDELAVAALNQLEDFAPQELSMMASGFAGGCLRCRPGLSPGLWVLEGGGAAP